MTLNIKNASDSCIEIEINESRIILTHDQTYMCDCPPFQKQFGIKLSILEKEFCATKDIAYCLNISTYILCNTVDKPTATIVIKKKSNRFQNYTQYQYLTIHSLGLNIIDIKHTVDNNECITNANSYVKKHKTSLVLHVLKKSIVDTILDGLLISVLIAWLCSLWIALGVLVFIFVIALIVNSIKIRTSKSKYRILNWDKDNELPDDIEYFVTHLEKYCS